jgi:DNA processing protein
LEAVALSAAEQQARIALSHLPDIGPRRAVQLVQHFGGIAAAWGSSAAHLQQALGWPSKGAEKVASFFQQDPAQLADKTLRSPGTHVIFPEDPLYPAWLRAIPDPPQVLFWRGNPDAWQQLQRPLAMVGTRQPTPYGAQIAERFAHELAAQGVAIVSGLAFGIDAAAHRGALKAQGLTVAVLGSGIDWIYPTEHRDLYQQICQYGLVLSEYPPGQSPKPWTFRLRNRIVSGLSRGLIVIEAGPKSGTLITVDCANEQGREVFALPGLITSEQSIGTHRLIQQGAHLLTDISEILAILGWENTPLPPPSPEPINLTNEEKHVYVLLSDHPLHVDEIAQRASLEPARLTGILTLLEMSGAVQQLPGKLYRRN